MSLRHGYSLAEEADFALNQCLYTQAMVESSEALQRPAPPAVLPLAPPRAKKRKVQACFAWNDGRACTLMPCHFSHCCSRCGGEHARRFCAPALEASPGDSARQACDSCLLYTVLWECATPHELDCLSHANTVVV